MQVQLYEKRGKTSVYIDAKIEENGDLLISGQDVGELPSKFWGDLDYEYWLNVASENKDRVFKSLIEYCDQVGIPASSTSRNKDEALLTLLEKVYGGKVSAFGEFWDLMKDHGIPAEFFSVLWRKPYCRPG